MQSRNHVSFILSKAAKCGNAPAYDADLIKDERQMGRLRSS